MSKQMICSFFPAHCSHIFEPFLPSLFQRLYPDDVVEACPEQVMADVFGSGAAVRRPFLALFAQIGICVGLLGAIRIQSNSLSPRGRGRNNYADFYWVLAFLFFGLMNLSGLYLHCLLPATVVSALERPLPWVGDTFTTGAFGSALGAAAMMETAFTAKWTTEFWIHATWAFGNFLGLSAIAWFLVFGYDVKSSFPGTLPLEMWYFAAPTVWASSALTWMLIRSFSWPLFLSFVLSYVAFVLAMVDPFLCRRFQNQFLDLWTAPTLFFLGTDIIFLGIALWLETRHNERRRILRKQM